MSNIILTKDTDIQGILSSDRGLILKQGNMNSISIFRFDPRCASDGTVLIGRGYLNRTYETYYYNERDRIVTMYPFSSMDVTNTVNQFLRLLRFENVRVSRYEEPEQLTITLADKEFVAMARRLGCHNFHVSPEDGQVFIAVKGISGRSDGVVMKDILDLGAHRSLYCKVFSEYLRNNQRRIPFNRVVKS